MNDLTDFFSFEPYSLAKEEKSFLLTSRLKHLTKQHIATCPQYSNMMKGYGLDLSKIFHYSELPFLPARLFKELQLKSVSDDDVFKTVTSSGTTGQNVSKIYLDKHAASAQQKVLVKIVSSFTGAARLPMLIIDSPSVIKNRAYFTVRGAGILGFSIFGADRVYALDDDMRIDFNAINSFLEKHKGKKILLFGFTFMVWQYFYKELLKATKKIDLSNGILIHGGGWKKMLSEAVVPEKFSHLLQTVCGLSDIHDYYGMVEQGGTIYMQCEQGHYHASIFSDVIIRNPDDFSLCSVGESGIVQVISSLPESYPGHLVLTEDEGVLLGEDDCPCGRFGKYFRISGRIQNAELRGCSDTYAARF